MKRGLNKRQLKEIAKMYCASLIHHCKHGIYSEFLSYEETDAITKYMDKISISIHHETLGEIDPIVKKVKEKKVSHGRNNH